MMKRTDIRRKRILAGLSRLGIGIVVPALIAAAVIVSVPTGAQSQATIVTSQIWSATLDVGDSGSGTQGYVPDFGLGDLSPTEFTAGDWTLTVKSLSLLDFSSPPTLLLVITAGNDSDDEGLAKADYSQPPTQYVLTVSGTDFAFDDAGFSQFTLGTEDGSHGGRVSLTWQSDSLDWSAGDELSVTLESRGLPAATPTPTATATATPNSPATGAPTISGTAQVGQTLTASTSGIADADGLTNVSYSYQWLADDTEIGGATSSTYTLQSSDSGKAIKVRVTFTDDADNEESLTSAATNSVTDLGSRDDANENGYDANENGAIEKNELIAAVIDYLDNGITKNELIAVINLYLFG